MNDKQDKEQKMQHNVVKLNLIESEDEDGWQINFGNDTNLSLKLNTEEMKSNKPKIDINMQSTQAWMVSTQGSLADLFEDLSPIRSPDQKDMSGMKGTLYVSRDQMPENHRCFGVQNLSRKLNVKTMDPIGIVNNRRIGEYPRQIPNEPTNDTIALEEIIEELKGSIKLGSMKHIKICLALINIIQPVIAEDGKVAKNYWLNQCSIVIQEPNIFLLKLDLKSSKGNISYINLRDIIYHDGTPEDTLLNNETHNKKAKYENSKISIICYHDGLTKQASSVQVWGNVRNLTQMQKRTKYPTTRSQHPCLQQSYMVEGDLQVCRNHTYDMAKICTKTHYYEICNKLLVARLITSEYNTEMIEEMNGEIKNKETMTIQNNKNVKNKNKNLVNELEEKEDIEMKEEEKEEEKHKQKIGAKLTEILPINDTIFAIKEQNYSTKLDKTQLRINIAMLLTHYGLSTYSKQISVAIVNSPKINEFREIIKKKKVMNQCHI